MPYKPGDVDRDNYQNDVYRRRFEVISVVGDVLTIKWLPLEDAVLEEMIADPYTPDYMIMRDIEITGTTSTRKIVSAAAWNAMF